MFKRARKKFILSAMAATFVVTAVLIITINLINFVQVTGNLQTAMTELSPFFETTKEDLQEPNPGNGENINYQHKERRGSAQVQYAGRYFIISIDTDGKAKANGGGVIMSEEEASELSSAILAKKDSTGFYNGYRYVVGTDADNTVISLLDCSTEISAMRSLLLTSLLVGLSGLLLTFLFIYYMSAKAIWPLKESMEKQKQFITDAGHELKTPLSVIGTNMDILALDLPDNEWITSTKKQIAKLRKLIEHLINLSRLEEEQTPLQSAPFNLSEVVGDTVDAFTGMGEMNGTPIVPNITDDLMVTADEATVTQLLTILTDNALKYALPDTEVMITLKKEGRHICFETCNTWDRSTPTEELSRLFDRFYRGDKSHSGSGKVKGYGLGLSIALAIAEKNHLQLSIHEDEQQRIVFRVIFDNVK